MFQWFIWFLRRRLFFLGTTGGYSGNYGSGYSGGSGSGGGYGNRAYDGGDRF